MSPTLIVVAVGTRTMFVTTVAESGTRSGVAEYPEAYTSKVSANAGPPAVSAAMNCTMIVSVAPGSSTLPVRGVRTEYFGLLPVTVTLSTVRLMSCLFIRRRVPVAVTPSDTLPNASVEAFAAFTTWTLRADAALTRTRMGLEPGIESFVKISNVSWNEPRVFGVNSR